MSKEKAQAIAVKHSELADIQGHGERAVLTLEQATRAILEYFRVNTGQNQEMIIRHILSVDGDAIGVLNWKLVSDGYSDCPRYPMVGEGIVVDDDDFIIENISHYINDHAIVYHLKKIGV